jgi:hypothetical protein
MQSWLASGTELVSRSSVLAGGCLWGVEAVFDHVKGVKRAVSGFAGGEKKTAHYETVSGPSFPSMIVTFGIATVFCPNAGLIVIAAKIKGQQSCRIVLMNTLNLNK